MGEWSQDGDVENSARKTLPERPQRSHWKFNTKYTSKIPVWRRDALKNKVNKVSRNLHVKRSVNALLKGLEAFIRV